METKFTKGEWKIVDTDVVAENGCAICQVYDASESNITEMDMEIVLANLKLIAAAPDMFEALSTMIRIKDIYMPNDINEVKPEHYDEMNTLCKAFRQMEKAIKRVTDIHFSINAPRIKIKLEFDGKVVSGSVPENKVEDFIRKAFEDAEKENPHLSVGIYTDNMKMFEGTSNFSVHGIEKEETNTKLVIYPSEIIEKLRSSNEILKSLLILFGDRMLLSNKLIVSNQILDNKEILEKATE